MGDNFDFLIITRFNLKHGFTKINVNDPEWLNYRFDLFEKYCLPSVKSQTFQQFKWLIFFDEELPQEFKEKFAAYKEEFKNLEDVYLPKFSFESMRSVCKSFASKDYLITSRLDSDDLLSKNYVSDVVSLFENQEDLLINFDCGYCYAPNKNVFTYVKYYGANPFMAFIERVSDDLKTVFIDAHDKLKKYPNQLNLNNKGFWCAVIHESNVVNRIVGKPILFKNSLELFPTISNEYRPIRNFNYIKLSIDYLVKYFKRFLRKFR